jgi:hypothetical protein
MRVDVWGGNTKIWKNSSHTSGWVILPPNVLFKFLLLRMMGNKKQ